MTDIQSGANRPTIEKINIIPASKDDDDANRDTIPSTATAFVLRGFLSADECQQYIKLAETDAHGLEPCGYDPTIRRTDRLELWSQDIGQLLWDRVQPFLEDRIVLSSPSVSTSNNDYNDNWREGIPRNTPEGTWIPTRVNQPIRICRYKPGGFFLPHHDGTCHNPSNERSLQTIMVYLNDDFGGGATSFYNKKQRHYCPGDPDNRIVSFQPQAGDALVFFSAITHDGGALTEGQKYILRSELMYRQQIMEGSNLQRSWEPDHDDTLDFVPDEDGGFDYQSDDDED